MQADAFMLWKAHAAALLRGVVTRSVQEAGGDQARTLDFPFSNPEFTQKCDHSLVTMFLISDRSCLPVFLNS